mmetsp:Transcript_8348/g.12804  ORF Transcript_8348/g.12804 Transcript_8348/m.12804 type:complete len:327 (-) Transcript_8348:86-1066(-)
MTKIEESCVPLSSPESERIAFTEAMAAIAPDLPLMMFGSGDVQPDDVNPETVALVAELTVQYINRLVDAAVDAHDLLTDGAGGFLPPPALPPHRVPIRPSTPEEPPPPPPPTTSKTKKDEIPKPVASKKKKRRRCADEDFWDQPLPEPKIRKPQSNSKPSNDAQMVARNFGNESVTSDVAKSSDDPMTTSSQVHVDEWVGVSGVDLFETARARETYVSAPSAMTTKCFIFPICHDAGLYGRVMEVQSARRNLSPYLADPVLAEMVQNEGSRRVRRIRHPKAKRASAGDNGDEGEEEEEEEENEEIIQATWPGLQSLLPIHQGNIFN